MKPRSIYPDEVDGVELLMARGKEEDNGRYSSISFTVQLVDTTAPNHEQFHLVPVCSFLYVQIITSLLPAYNHSPLCI